jgi:hypothetical protein
MARPSKFNEALRETILKLYKQGRTDKEVAGIIGVCEKTIQNWKGKYPTFLLALKESKFVADGLVESSLFGRATGYSHEEEKIFMVDGKAKRVKTIKQYPPDVTAAIFWLKNRQPEKWRENYELDIHDMDKKSDKELSERIATLTKLLGKK